MKHKIYYLVIVTLFIQTCIFSPHLVKGQIQVEGKAGLALQFGTHLQRIGLMYQLYAFNDFMQITHGGYFHFHLRNFGPRGKYPELKLQFGAQGHWGWRMSDSLAMFNELSNLSDHAYSAGYSFYVYRDGKETKQTTGLVHGQIESLSLAVANDAFGTNPYEDKYRTGAFMISWQQNEWLWSVQSTLWTGKSYDAPKVKDSDYPEKKGYRDPSDVKYGKYSHGILAVRTDYVTEFNQALRAELGLDGEQIRNFFQNELIHDAMPDRWVGYENPHYPMLQPNGSPYLYKDGQRIKPVKPYLQIGTNEATFY